MKVTCPVTSSADEFDDARLDDNQVLAGHDAVLRGLALTGAHIRVEASAAEALALDAGLRPRGIVLAGNESRLIRSVIETTCPAPLVAWPHLGLPGWAGPLDLVVVQGSGAPDEMLASTALEATRRGCALLVAAPADGVIAQRLPSHGVTFVATTTNDPVAAVVGLLDLLWRVGLGPAPHAESIADAADMVAEQSSPHKDLSINPAKVAAIALADALPLVWGGSMLAARAARRIAEEIRRTTGRPSLAATASDLAPLLLAAEPNDPFADLGEQASQPVLVTLDDGDDDQTSQRERAMLENVADARQLRVVRFECDDAQAGAVGRHVALLLQGLYAAAYLGVGFDHFAS